MPDKTIYLCTFFDAEGKETERLVSADTRGAAVKHVAHFCVASAADVARVLGAGGRVEDAAE